MDGRPRLLSLSSTDHPQSVGENLKPDGEKVKTAGGSKPGIDVTKILPGEGFKRPWPPLIKMDEAVKAKVEILFNP